MKILSHRFFPLLCGVLFLAFLAEHVLFCSILTEVTPWYYPLFGTASDLLWPAIFLACAVFLSSGTAVVFFVLSFCTVVFIKTANLVLFRNMLDIFSFANFRLLMEHTDLQTLRIEFGPLWTLKAAGIVLAFLACACALIIPGIRYVKKGDTFAFVTTVRFLLLGMILGGIWAEYYYITYSEEIGKTYFKREFPVRPCRIWIADFYHDYKSFRIEEDQSPQSGFLPGRISPESAKILTDFGLLPFRREPAAPPADPPFRKIIVIASESLNLDYLKTYNATMPDGLTPFLDDTARKYVSFKNYYTASQPTSWALDAIFLSRVDYLLDRKRRAVSICDILREHSWKTFYFTSNTRMCFNSGAEYTAMFRPDTAMFQEEIFLRYGYRGSHYWGIGDNELFDSAFRTLESDGGNRFFCVISTIDLHDPYTVTGPAADMPGTGNRFLDALRCTDRNIGDFVERVMASPMFDDETLIVITADHSATFGVNYTKRKDFMPDRIPLLLITKGNRLQGVFDTEKYASQMDLPPTLLSLLGIPAPETFMGCDMRSGKNFAFARTVDRIFLYLPSGEKHVYLQTAPPKTPQEKALLEFFDTFYGVETENDMERK